MPMDVLLTAHCKSPSSSISLQLHDFVFLTFNFAALNFLERKLTFSFDNSFCNLKPYGYFY
ncbi:hypothetical protein T4D_9604 [Trichinella pseudospiralis]|uniref:Uncharacterized protein n=1 Tax=Trichinella pseudospiralis TaxID=6337 RepID=A0A0V1FPJ8_TRIPS|nr:hypothetical protein T4D_9604 [Trichinella pseudospiralis]